VLEPAGALPQAAWRLDATPIAHDNEILCEVEALNIDSASFRQIADANDGEPARVAAHVLALVEERGKHHNPVTGSGGMFIGRVRAVGAGLGPSVELRAGDRIASLVSLTLTPLRLEAIERIDMASGRLWVRGTAVLFASGIFAKSSTSPAPPRRRAAWCSPVKRWPSWAPTESRACSAASRRASARAAPDASSASVPMRLRPAHVSCSSTATSMRTWQRTRAPRPTFSRQFRPRCPSWPT
jgi:hypothetical protein